MAAGRKRKGVTDPLDPVDEPRWLVVRDLCRRVLEYQELWPGRDLRAALAAECDRRTADGWTVDDIPPHCAFCFAQRAHERVCITVECHAPGTAPLR
jgi:hypothetical protein